MNRSKVDEMIATHEGANVSLWKLQEGTYEIINHNTCEIQPSPTLEDALSWYEFMVSRDLFWQKLDRERMLNEIQEKNRKTILQQEEG